MNERLAEIERRFEEIEAQLLDPNVSSNPSELHRLGKARADLQDVVEAIRALKSARQELEDTEMLLDDSDPGIRDMAQEDLPSLKQRVEETEEALKLLLLPKDPNDDKPVVIEIRPAAGGDEAGLFAAELFRMYSRYAERKRWPVEVVEHQEEGLGGISRVTFTIGSRGAYSQLKHESGVHRVQRVPATESSGRIHTSTVTVAVLPEAEEVDVDIRADDLEITTFRSSSAGGQHMQKNETAIRIIHKPSGVVVTCQDERSQAQNKIKAMTVLRSKLYEAELERQAKEQGSLRRGQIGSGDRSEKIRTYNFPQSRITDHRIGVSMHNMITFMDGDIQDMIDALRQAEQAKKLAEQSESAAAGV